MMIQGLHGAVFFIGSLIAVGYGDEVTTDLCRLPNGVFPNPEDCSSFISCSNGQHYVEKCPDGLLYNPSRSTCDFSETGDCSSSDDFEPSTAFVRTDDIDCSPEGPNIYPVPNSCSDYYLCDNGEPFRVECPSGLHMNRDTLTCDHPENVNCDVDSSTDSPTVGVEAIYVSNGGDAEVMDELDATTTTTKSSSTPSSAQPVDTSPLTKVNTISTKDTTTETLYDVKIPTTTKSIITESTTLHQTTLKEKETSIAVSVTEYTVNKQPTVVTVSTEQTKEGSNENDSKETTSKSDLEITTMNPSSIDITTINDQATSSDTTNPYPDLTNSEEHSTQSFSKQPMDSTLSTSETSSVASVSETNTPVSMQQTTTDSSQILTTDFQISSDADDGSLQSSVSDLNLTEIPITDRNNQSTPVTNESVSPKEYTSEANSTLEEKTTSGMKDTTGMSSIITSESPVNFTTTITKLKNVTSQEKVTSSKVTSDVPVTDPTAISLEYKTTKNILEETTTSHERNIVTEGITSMTDEKLSSSFPNDKTKSEMEETDASYQSTVKGIITSTDDVSNSVVTDVSVHQNETSVEISATTKPVSENESSTSQSEISSELTTKDTVYIPDDATQTTVHLKTTETENSHSSDIDSTTVNYTKIEPVGTDVEMKLSTTLKPIDPSTISSTSEQSSSSVNTNSPTFVATESDPNTVISSSTFTTSTVITEITHQPSESLDDHDTQSTRSELFTPDAQTDDKITPEKTMGTSQGLMSSDPSTDNEMDKFVTSNYSTMTNDLIQTNNEISSEDLTNLTSSEITGVSFSTEKSHTISSGNETDQTSSDGFKNDTKSTSYFIAEESTTKTKDLTSNNLFTESILTQKPKVLTETATSINMLTTKATMDYSPISSTDLTSVSDVSSLPSSSDMLTTTSDSSESLPSETSSSDNLTSITHDKISTAVEFASTKESPLTSAEQTFPVSETNVTEQEKITVPSSTEITRSDTAVVTTASDFVKSTTDTFPEDTSDVPKDTTKSDIPEGTESDVLTNAISNTPVAGIVTNSDDLHVFTEDPFQNASITFKDDASQSTSTSNSIKTTDDTTEQRTKTSSFEIVTERTTVPQKSTSHVETTSSLEIVTERTTIPQKLTSDLETTLSLEIITEKPTVPQKSTSDVETTSFLEINTERTTIPQKYTPGEETSSLEIVTERTTGPQKSTSGVDEVSSLEIKTERTIPQETTSDVETSSVKIVTGRTTIPQKSTFDVETSPLELITEKPTTPQKSTPDEETTSSLDSKTERTTIPQKSTSDVETSSLEIATERTTISQKSTPGVETSSVEIVTEKTTVPQKSTNDVKTTSSLEIKTERTSIPQKFTSDIETSSLEIITERTTASQKSTSGAKTTSSLEILTDSTTIPDKSSIGVDTTSSLEIVTQKTTIPQKSTSDLETTLSLEIITEKPTVPQKSTSDVETTSVLEIKTEGTTIPQKYTQDEDATSSLENKSERTIIPQKSTSDVETSSFEIVNERTTISHKFTSDVETTSSLEIITESTTTPEGATSEISSLSENTTESITTTPQKRTFDVETTSSVERMTDTSTAIPQTSTDMDTTSSIKSITERTTIFQKSTSEIETTSSPKYLTESSSVPPKSTSEIESSSRSENVTESITITPHKPTFDLDTTSVERRTDTSTAIPQTSTDVDTTSSVDSKTERTTILQKFTSEVETSSLKNLTESTSIPPKLTSEVESSSLSENVTESIITVPQKYTSDVETTSSVESITESSQKSTYEKTTSSLENITRSDVTNSDYMHSTGITLDTTIGISERSTTISSTNLEDITTPTNHNDEITAHSLSTVTSDYSHTNGLTSDTTDFDSTPANFRTKITTIENSKSSEEMFTISLTSDFTSENEKISTVSPSIGVSDTTSLKTVIITNEPITTDVDNSSYLPSEEISTQDREPKTFSTSQTIYQSTNHEDPTDIPTTFTEFSTSYLSTEKQENLTESTEIGSSKSDLSSTYSIPKYSQTEPQTTTLSTTNQSTTDSTIYETSASWRPSNDTPTEEIIPSTIKDSSTAIPTDLATLIDIETSSKLDTTTGLQTISTTSSSFETTTLTQLCIEANGFYPNSEDCNTFYQCSKGVPKLSSCTENNHFNPVLKRCEDPCRAKCDPNLDCPSTENESSSEGTTSQLTTTENILHSTTEDYSVSTEIHTKGTRPADDLISVSDSTFETTSTDSKYSSTRDSTSESEATSVKISTEYTSLPTTQVTTEYSSISTDASTSEEYPTSLDVSTTEVPSSSVTHSYPTSASTEHTDKMDDTTESPTSRAPVSETESTTVTEAIKSTTPGITNKYTDESIEPTSPQYETTFTQDVSSYSTGGYTIVSSLSTHKDTEEPSSASTVSASVTPTTECKNNDCLSSKVPAASTPVPYTVCHRNDFLARPSCAEYMDCTQKFPQKKKCPMGLYFNPTTRVCDWPHSAECGQMPKPLFKPDDSFECPCKSCLIPSQESCSHYYLCLGYTAYHMKCSNSLLFDKKLNTCNYAITVECLGSTSTTDSTVPTKPSTTTKTTTTTTTTTRPPTSSTTVKPERFVCPRREGLFKYPGNCGRFYQCSNWFPYKMSCPVTTHFSELTKRCEYPCDAKCDLSISCGESSTPPNDPRCTCHNCKLPSAETCTKYIVCVNGRARLENCPWGQTFDVRREHCDWAHKVECRHSEMCPELSGVFPHKDDCHKFVHCSNGIPYVKKCPSVLEFDAGKKRCEWPSGRCQHSLIPKEFTFREKEHREGWRCPKAFGYFADEHHCNRFYYCSLGTPYMKECPEGLLYNPRQQTCDWKKHARCNSNRRQPPKRCRAYDRHVICESDRMPQSHAHCNMYYDCTAGRACAKQCPIGLYFNITTGICDLPANVRCFHDRKEYSLKEISVSCLSSDSKRMADPTDDSCFYRCRQGTLISGCCSRGRVYNQHRDKCERRTKSFRI